MLENAHILFADDDGYYRELGREVLNDQHCRVTVAADGAECLQHLKSDRIDLVIVDLEMPRVSGLEVLEAIRRHPELSQLPVVVITGHDDTASIEQAYTAGATSFMTKPFDWALFIYQVRFVLKAAQTAAELRVSARNIDFMRGLQDRFLQSLLEDAHAPLRATMNLATIMELEADGPLGSAYYKTCVSEIASGLRRIQATHLKMLQWSENTGAAIKLDESVVDLRSLMRASSDETEARCRRRHIRLETEFKFNGNVLLTCDRALFLQALQCVLAEATRLTRPAGEVRMTTAIDADNRLVIDVKDEAAMHASLCGDDPDMKPSKPAAETRLSATLQMAKAIIVAHGGTFTMKPDSLGGASTTIELPAKRVLQATDPLLAESAEPQLNQTAMGISAAQMAAGQLASGLPTRKIRHALS